MVTIHNRPFAPPTQRVGLAIAAMVLGILAIVFIGLGMVTLAWLAVAPFAMVPALVCGLIALRRADRNPVAYKGRGFAFTGIIAAFASIPLAFVVMAISLSGPFLALLHSVMPGPAPSMELSSSQINIRMHDTSSLTELPYFDSQMQCRMCLPRASESIDILPPPDPSVLRDFSARGPDFDVIVAILPRGDTSFYDFVQQNLAKLLGNEGNKFTIEESGRATVNGHDLYVVTANREGSDGTVTKARLAMVDGPASRVYALYGTTSADGWGTFAEVFDSAFSTFEIGDFQGEPSLVAGPQPVKHVERNPVPQTDVPSPPSPPATPVTAQPKVNSPLPPPPPSSPPPPPEDVTPTPPAAPHDVPAKAAAPLAAPGPHISTLDEALAALQAPDNATHQAAYQYLENAPLNDSRQFEIIVALGKGLSDPALRAAAFAAYTHWATKNDAPVLRQFLADLVKADHGLEGATEGETVMQLLAGYGDTESAPLMVAGLHNFFLRSAASKALITLGPGIQSTVWPALSDADSGVAEEGLNILAKIGTEQSIPAIQQAMNGRDAQYTQRAGDTITAINKRLKLAPGTAPR